MTTYIGVGLYVLSNCVRHDDGRRWEFSSHVAAVAALLRLNTPDYAPLSGWGPGDLERFEEMRAEVAA